MSSLTICTFVCTVALVTLNGFLCRCQLVYGVNRTIISQWNGICTLITCCHTGKNSSVTHQAKLACKLIQRDFIKSSNIQYEFPVNNKGRPHPKKAKHMTCYLLKSTYSKLCLWNIHVLCCRIPFACTADFWGGDSDSKCRGLGQLANTTNLLVAVERLSPCTSPSYPLTLTQSDLKEGSSDEYLMCSLVEYPINSSVSEYRYIKYELWKSLWVCELRTEWTEKPKDSHSSEDRTLKRVLLERTWNEREERDAVKHS